MPTLEEIVGQKGLTLEEITASAAPQGDVSALAQQRLSHLNPNAPEGPGMIQRGLGAIVGTETAARMAGELPAAAGLIAMAAQPELAIPKAAAWGPKMLAFARGAAQRVLAGSAASGVSKGALTGSATAGVEEAKTSAAYGAAGEGLGAGLMFGAKGIGLGGKTALNYLRGTKGGQVATREVADAIGEHASTTANRILDAVGQKSIPELVGEDVGAMVRKFDTVAADAALEMYEIPKIVARDAKLPNVDISPIAKDLKDIVKADEKVGGFLSPVATLDPTAAAITSGARTASKDVSKVAGTAARVAQTGTDAGAAAAEELRLEVLEILKSRKATVPALMNIRGKVSQIIADPSKPDELRLVAKRIGTERLDRMIEGALDTVGGADTWRAAVRNYAETAAIKEQALYRLAKKSPERIHEFIAPNRPDTVTTLRKLSQLSGMEDVIPNVQRSFLEARLGKGVENFGQEIEKFGPKTISALFADPRGAQAVSGLKELSNAIAEKMTAVGAGPEIAREHLLHAMTRAVTPGAAGGIAGYRATHSWEGGVAGMAAGATIGTLAPYQIVKLAAKPDALRRTTALIRGLSSDSTPRTVDALARVMGSALNEKEATNAAQVR